MVLDASRRAPLLAAKLGALVGIGWPNIIASPLPFTAGAGVVASGPGPRVAWVLLDENRVERDPLATDDDAVPRLPRGWLGGAVVWALRQGVEELHVLSEHLTGHDARRAGFLGGGVSVSLWCIRGRELRAVDAVAPPVPIEPPASHRAFAATLTGAGIDVVVERGVVQGEILGLEIARVVGNNDVDNTDAPELQVGVGRHDRLAHQMLHPGPEGVSAALADAIATVRAYRRAGAAMHPANRLAPERWLRAVVVRDPTIAGVGVGLHPADPTTASRLKWASPAIAAGDGVVVACTVGLDLDAVTDAADARAALDAHARLVLVATEGHPALTLLAAQLRPPAEVVVVRPDWRGHG